MRNRLLIRGLSKHYPVTVVASERHSYPERFVEILPRLIDATRRADIIVCGFLGQPLALVARLLRKPILLDAFVSVYDTLCLDRHTTSPSSPLGRASFALDQYSMRAANLVLVDTASQRAFFASTFGVSPDHYQVHYLGPDFELTTSRTSPRVTGVVNVLHYGSYLPLHGTEVIVEAAQLTREDSTIRYTFIGSGPRYGKTRSLASKIGLSNVHFVDWLPIDRLAKEIQSATIGLGGHFADNPKARRVIAGKSYQFLASGIPTIVGDCESNRELFASGREVLMVPMADPGALAQAIRTLADAPMDRARIGDRGSDRVRELFAPERVANQLQGAVKLALDRATR